MLFFPTSPPSKTRSGGQIQRQQSQNQTHVRRLAVESSVEGARSSAPAPFVPQGRPPLRLTSWGTGKRRREREITGVLELAFSPPNQPCHVKQYHHLFSVAVAFNVEGPKVRACIHRKVASKRRTTSTHTPHAIAGSVYLAWQADAYLSRSSPQFEQQANLELHMHT